MIRPLAVAAFAVALLAAPAAASAAPEQAPGCEVGSATLEWGFKESFRAYIDGSIANGEWTVADGATYDTPTFGWRSGVGTIDEALVGEIAFTGSVRFTGHQGVLDTTIADPVIRFEGPDRATLVIDVSGPTMDGTVIDAADVPFAAIDLSGAGVVTRREGVLYVEAASTSLTAAGTQAFPDYAEGEAFDPVTIVVPVGDDCAVATGVIGDDTPLVVLVAALGGLLVVIAVVLLVLRLRR